MKKLLFVVGITLFLTTGTHAAVTVVVNDGFDDGDRTNGADALDVAWWKVKDSSGGSLFLTVKTDDGSPGIGSGNALEVESTSSNNRTIAGDFSDREVTLSNPGDTILLSFDFRILNVPPTNSANDFRFGLFNNGGTVVTADLGGDDTLVDDDRGYNVTLSTGGSQDSARLYNDGGNSTLLGGNDRDELVEDNNFAAIGEGNLKHTARLTLTRNVNGAGDPTMDVVFVLDEGTAGEKSLAANHTGSTSNPLVFTFNEIGISNHDDSIDCIIDNVVVGIVDPVIDAGNDKYVRLADAAAGVELVGLIVNYDSQKSYTYTWSDDPCAPPVTFSPPVPVVDPSCPTTATFPGTGTYTLTLEVTNESGSTSDTVTVTVVEPREIQSGWWKLDDGAGTTVTDSSTGPFNHPGTVVEPGWQPGWVGCADGSLLFDGEPNSVVAIPADTGPSDPNGNLDNIQYGITIAAWVNTVPNGSSQRVLIKDDAFELRIQDDGTLRLKIWHERSGYNMTDSDESELGANLIIADGRWHHVAATYSVFDEMAAVYFDGILIHAEEDNELIWLAELDIDQNLYIGQNYVGGIDDVQLYSYALDSTAIETLAAMGDTIPMVNAGPDEEYLISDIPLQLKGRIEDVSSTPTNVGWTVISGNPASVTFTDDTDPATTVEFDRNDPGTFVLQLSATDTLCGQEVVVTDTVTVTTVLPTCADVIANGLTLAMDFSGPIEGQPDCYVNLFDLAYLAKSWLKCNNPEDPACAWAWE